MELIVGSDEIFSFESKGFVELPGIFTEKELTRLKDAIESTLEKRYEASKERFHRFKPKDWYLKSRDLFRDSADIRRVLLNGKLGKVAAQLIHQKPLRLAADQWLFGGQPLPFRNNLMRSFPFQGTLMGAMISLGGDSQTPQNEEETPPSLFFSKEPGHVVLFKGGLPLDFAEDYAPPPSCNYLTVVITKQKAIYTLQENDPCTHHLKSLGFGFGDRLNDVEHPYLIR